MAALLCGLSALAGIVTGCEDKPLAFNYCPTPVEGWEPGDTLKFHVDTVKTAGTYRIDLGYARRRQRPTPFSRCGWWCASIGTTPTANCVTR